MPVMLSHEGLDRLRIAKLTPPPSLWLFALIPLCVTAACIGLYAVNTPWLEEWDHVQWFEKLAEGNLQLSDVFAQQNEYRQLFPNLLFLLMGVLTHGDVRFGMAASFLLACFVSFACWRLAGLRLHRAPTHMVIAYALANVLIFSPLQYENWLQGQQLIYFAPIACLAACLLVASSARLSAGARFTACAVLCTISTFSSANGMLCWLLVLPALLLYAREGRVSQRWIGLWFVALALNVALYMHGYQSPSYVPTGAERAAVYFLALLGRPFVPEGTSLSACIGATLLVAFGWICIESWRRRRERQQFRRMLPWLIIGCYSLLTAVLITFGRAAAGAEPSRYTTFTLYLPVALVFLVAICMAERADASRRGESALAWRRIMALLALGLVAWQVPVYLIGISQMSNWHIRTLASKSCVLLANVLQDDCAKLSTELTRDFSRFTRLANVLDRLGFVHAPMVRTADPREIAMPSFAPARAHGSFTSLIHKGSDEYIASGTAFSGDSSAPAHLVLLAYEGTDGRPTLFAIGHMNTDRDIASAVLGRGDYRDAHWRRRFRIDQLPAGEWRVSAWAFDADTGRAYELEGTHLVHAGMRQSREQSR